MSAQLLTPIEVKRKLGTVPGLLELRQ